MAHKVKSVEEGRNRIAESLNNGTALEKFKRMLIEQKVDENVADALCYGNDTAAVLPMAKYEIEIDSPTSGNLVVHCGKVIFTPGDKKKKKPFPLASLLSPASFGL